jgi:hypothetical protein
MHPTVKIKKQLLNRLTRLKVRLSLDESIGIFARILEHAGYHGALDLIQEELVPIARENGLNLINAARRYSDDDEEQDTSWYQLHMAIIALGKDEFNLLMAQPALSKTKLNC